MAWLVEGGPVTSSSRQRGFFLEPDGCSASGWMAPALDVAAP